MLHSQNNIAHIYQFSLSAVFSESDGTYKLKENDLYGIS